MADARGAGLRPGGALRHRQPRPAQDRTTCARSSRASSTARASTSSRSATPRRSSAGFARLHGFLVGIVANNGVLFSESALKATHFIELCNLRGIPLVFLQNITGLHGRPAVRARRHRQGRRQDGARGGQLGGAEVHGRHRRLVRRRQLRHVRARLRAAAAVDVAERAHLGDGRRAGGRRADHGQARSAGARGPALLAPRTKPRSASRSCEKYDEEGSPYYSTARLWDDGILDPAETRPALALGLSAAYNAPDSAARSSASSGCDRRGHRHSR